MKAIAELPNEQRVGDGAGIGTILRQQRLRLAQDIGEVAARLRIRQAYLVAIEEGRFAELPGPTYAIGFVRSYADYLGLDTAQVVQQFKQQTAGGLDSRPELVFPSPVSEGRVPGGAILFLGLLLAAGAYGGWYYMSTQEASIAELVPALPDRLRAMVYGDAAPGGADDLVLPGESAVTAAAPAPVASAAVQEVVPPTEQEEPEHAAQQSPLPPPAATQESVAAVTPAPAAPPAATASIAMPPAAMPPAAPAPVTVALPPEPAAAAPAAAAAAVPPPAPPEVSAAVGDAPRVYGQTNLDSRIVLRAADDSWVQVREGEAVLLMRLMRKGDVFRVPNRPGLTLMTGSAGALEVTVDGKAVPPLGAIGAVRRDIALDAEKLLASAH